MINFNHDNGKAYQAKQAAVNRAAVNAHALHANHAPLIPAQHENSLIDLAFGTMPHPMGPNEIGNP